MDTSSSTIKLFMLLRRFQYQPNNIDAFVFRKREMAATAAAAITTAAAADTVVLSVRRLRRKRVGRRQRPLGRPSLLVDDSNDAGTELWADHRQSRLAVTVMPAADMAAWWSPAVDARQPRPGTPGRVGTHARPCCWSQWPCSVWPHRRRRATRSAALAVMKVLPARQTCAARRRICRWSAPRAWSPRRIFPARSRCPSSASGWSKRTPPPSKPRSRCTSRNCSSLTVWQSPSTRNTPQTLASSLCARYSTSRTSRSTASPWCPRYRTWSSGSSWTGCRATTYACTTTWWTCTVSTSRTRWGPPETSAATYAVCTSARTRETVWVTPTSREYNAILFIDVKPHEGLYSIHVLIT